jgi:hypothetical protein
VPQEISGFDIIMAAYVTRSRSRTEAVFKNHYDCFTGTADLYVFFEDPFDCLNRKVRLLLSPQTNGIAQPTEKSYAPGWLETRASFNSSILVTPRYLPLSLTRRL